MKRYKNLGDLLLDYREYYVLSQSDLAEKLDVDIRTVQRWERNDTLVRPEKEAELAHVTLLPYQLIRNLNSLKPIPTYYDFRLRKYALSDVDIALPHPEFIKSNINRENPNLQTINVDDELDAALVYIEFQYEGRDIIQKEVLKQAIRLLPELNLILRDSAGFYAGHCIVLPLPFDVYQKLRNREIFNSDIKVSDIINYKSVDKPVFFAYSVTADSNQGISYIDWEIIRFFQQKQFKDYLAASFTKRYDSLELNKSLGLKIVWKEEVPGKQCDKYLYEGKFDEKLLRG